MCTTRLPRWMCLHPAEIFSSLLATTGQLQVTTNWTSANVFLLGDTIEPDIVSLLLMLAGDVETNPGPNRCGDCGINFSAQIKPVQCSECEYRYCRIAKQGQKTTCSGLTRWQLKKGKPLFCYMFLHSSHFPEVTFAQRSFSLTEFFFNRTLL